MLDFLFGIARGGGVHIYRTNYASIALSIGIDPDLERPESSMLARMESLGITGFKMIMLSVLMTFLNLTVIYTVNPLCSLKVPPYFWKFIKVLEISAPFRLQGCFIWS